MDELVSVIIPVGPKHTALVAEAVRSVELQTYGAYEIIIVNNSGQGIAPLPHTTLGSPRNNISLARNLGLEASAGQFVLFLDADDLLPPDALRILTDAYAAFDGSYVYGDWYNVFEDGSANYSHALTKDKLFWGGIHPVSALVPTAIARAVGGFDEAYAGRWEDWEFWLRLAAHGHCGERIPQATLLYRRWTGSSFLTAIAEGDELINELQARYRPYLLGDTAMACCGKSGAKTATAKGAFPMGINDKPPTALGGDGIVILEYTGPKRGSFTRKINNNPYAFGANERNRYAEVQAADVADLLLFGDVRVVPKVVSVDVSAVMASVKPEQPAPKAIRAKPEPDVQAVPEFDPAAKPAPPDPEAMAASRAKIQAHATAVQTNAIAPSEPVQAIRVTRPGKE